MNQTVLFTIIVLVIVFAVTVSSYYHKRHMEYKMSDIEKAVRKSFPKGVDSITKQELVTGIKKHFHCSARRRTTSSVWLVARSWWISPLSS